jgi:hypothetical protein
MKKHVSNKRSYHWASALALALILAPLTTLAGTYGDLTYESDGSSITITDCATTVTNTVIPETISGLLVKSIVDRAFYNSALRSLMA